MDLGIKNKKALVFASSEGLGKAVARALVEEGANVFLSSRSEDKLSSAVTEVGADGYIRCDLSQRGAARKLVQSAIEKLGGLDILVTNAGGPPAGAFQDISVEQWQTSYQSLFMSLVESIQEAAPEMKKSRWGRILMITSVAGKEPIKNLTISNALRAGVHGLANTLSKELAPHGITVNALLPTYTETQRLIDLSRNKEDLVARIPVGRLGKPGEFGKLAAFLASDHAGFITGQAIGYDGGCLASM
jgi:3-oxoacyl-[acyl-carrier protein] reductase